MNIGKAFEVAFNRMKEKNWEKISNQKIAVLVWLQIRRWQRWPLTLRRSTRATDTAV